MKSLRHYYRRRIDKLSNRHEWVKNALTKLRVGVKILDAGCGSQQFRSYCKNLSYYTQDVLSKHGFEIEEIKQVGDYYSWSAMEIWRAMSTHGFFAKFMLAPALLYYLNKNPTSVS